MKLKKIIDNLTKVTKIFFWYTVVPIFYQEVPTFMSKQEVIEIRRVDKVIDGIMDKVCAACLSLILFCGLYLAWQFGYIMYVYARVLM